MLLESEKPIEEQINKSAFEMWKMGIYNSREEAEIEIRESWERMYGEENK